MKKQLVFGLLAVLIITTVSPLAVYGTGSEVSRKYENEGFTALSVASGMRLEVKQAKQYEVIIRTKKSQLNLVEVEQVGKTLKFYHAPFTITTAPIEIFVTMPELTTLNLSGGSTAGMSMNIEQKTFSASLSGGSRLTGSLQTQQLEFDLSGGSRSNLTGEADTMRIDASGGSRVQHENFVVNKAVLSLSGGSFAYIFVKEMIEVDASGGSQIHYRGNPKLGRTSFSGGSGMRSLE